MRQSTELHRICARMPQLGSLLVCGLLCVTQPVDAQDTYQRLHSFGPTSASGTSPRGNLLQGSDDFLYGITYGGGTNAWGTIYRVAPSGSSFAVLHHFEGPTVFPISGLIETQDGSLYGTVANGGAYNSGIIYRIQKDGTGYSAVHSFNPLQNDGQSPQAQLVEATDGYLYGTTASGGASGAGIVFRMSLDGNNYSVIHHFAGAQGGAQPASALIEGSDGGLYGTTRKGGSADCGTVFRLSKDGTQFSTLRSFLGRTLNDGSEPLAEVCQGSDGFLYGTTYFGGTNDVGTFYRLGTNGADYQVIYYCRHETDNAAQPISGLLQAPDGLLYGATPRGGNGQGVAFKISTNGQNFTVLHHFPDFAGDGEQPYSPLLLAKDGSFFGTTVAGGANASTGASGVIFRLSYSFNPGRLILTSVSPQAVSLTFLEGTAGKSYEVQRGVAGVGSSWQTIGVETANSSGKFVFQDLAPDNAKTFYRTKTE